MTSKVPVDNKEENKKHVAMMKKQCDERLARYDQLLSELIGLLGCDKRMARKIIETTVGKYLLDKGFEESFYSDCLDTEVEIVIGSVSCPE